MTSQELAFHEFAEFAAKLKGDEKSESILFLLQLLDAFGHDGSTAQSYGDAAHYYSGKEEAAAYRVKSGIQNEAN